MTTTQGDSGGASYEPASLQDSDSIEQSRLAGQIDTGHLMRMSALSPNEKSMLDAFVYERGQEWHALLLLVLPLVMLALALPFRGQGSAASSLIAICFLAQVAAYIYLKHQYALIRQVLLRYTHHLNRAAFHIERVRDLQHSGEQPGEKA